MYNLFCCAHVHWADLCVTEKKKMQMPPKKSPDLIESHACEIVNIDLKFQPERCSPDDGQLSADAGNVDFLFFFLL